MPANQLRPPRELCIEKLVRVMICSAACPCPICRGDYIGRHHAPVLLRPCDHFFGKPRILERFEGDKDTCPFDMRTLFTLATDLYKVERWSLGPISDLSNRTGEISGESGGPGETIQRINQISDRLMSLGSGIVIANGRLSQESCFGSPAVYGIITSAFTSNFMIMLMSSTRFQSVMKHIKVLYMMEYLVALIRGQGLAAALQCTKNYALLEVIHLGIRLGGKDFREPHGTLGGRAWEYINWCS